MQLNGWERALKVTADGTGPVGHAGAVLLRKAADQAGPDRLAGPGRCGRLGNRPFSTGGSSSLSAPPCVPDTLWHPQALWHPQLPAVGPGVIGGAGGWALTSPCRCPPGGGRGR